MTELVIDPTSRATLRRLDLSYDTRLIGREQLENGTITLITTQNKIGW